MARTVFAIIILIGSILGFVLYIGPEYQEIRTLRTEEARLKEVLTNARTLQEKRDALLARYNNFSREDVARLEKMVPNNADNVKLILELQTLASRYGLEVQTAALAAQEATSATQRTQVTTASADYGTIGLTLVIRGSYEGFVNFLEDVENSLRIIDVDAIAFRPETSNPSLFQFNLGLKTYWLKQIN